MNIYLKTEVSANYLAVYQRFDRALFEALAPPFPKPNLLRFDGSKKGNEVHIELLLPFGIRQKWISIITEDVETTDNAWFIDEGKVLPFFLTKWKHKHLIQKKTENTCEIIDDIAFSSPFGYLLYPILYLQFAYRKPIYRKYFRNL